MENTSSIIIQIFVAILIIAVMIMFARLMIFDKKKKSKSLCVGSDGGACRFCETCIIVEEAKKQLKKSTK